MSDKKLIPIVCVLSKSFKFVFKKVIVNSKQNNFNVFKIQSKTIDLSTRFWGITTEFVGFIPQSLVLRSIIVLSWKLIYRGLFIRTQFLKGTQSALGPRWPGYWFFSLWKEFSSTWNHSTIKIPLQSFAVLIDFQSFTEKPVCFYSSYIIKFG